MRLHHSYYRNFVQLHNNFSPLKELDSYYNRDFNDY